MVKTGEGRERISVAVESRRGGEGRNFGRDRSGVSESMRERGEKA